MKNGYDLGGAEYPYDAANLTVVDILKPADSEMADWLLRDLNGSSWSDGLQPRHYVYIGKTLRYLEVSQRHARRQAFRFAQQLDSIVSGGGRIEMFDWLRVIEPVMTQLLMLNDQYRIGSIDLINPPLSHDADYLVIIKKG